MRTFQKSRGHEAAADRGGMDGAAFRVARLRAREVQPVIFTGADRTLAVGAGQMSRVDAVKVAVMKAGGSLPAASPHRMRFSRSATASTRLPPPARQPSCSPADRCATPR